MVYCHCPVTYKGSYILANVYSILRAVKLNSSSVYIADFVSLFTVNIRYESQVAIIVIKRSNDKAN